MIEGQGVVEAASEEGLELPSPSTLDESSGLLLGDHAESTTNELPETLPGLATNSIFFLFPFCESSLICLEGKSMTPLRGNTILFRSSQQLPRLRLGPSKGFLS